VSIARCGGSVLFNEMMGVGASAPLRAGNMGGDEPMGPGMRSS
jgi:hypothetical protein